MIQVGCRQEPLFHGFLKLSPVSCALLWGYFQTNLCLLLTTGDFPARPGQPAAAATEPTVSQDVDPASGAIAAADAGVQKSSGDVPASDAIAPPSEDNPAKKQKVES